MNESEFYVAVDDYIMMGELFQLDEMSSIFDFISITSDVGGIPDD